MQFILRLFLKPYLIYLNMIRQVPYGFTLNRKTNRIELKEQI